VTPLVAAAYLELAVLVAAKNIEIESLQQHITELRIADTRFPVLHACPHTLFGNHLVNREMFTNVAQKFEKTDRGCPGGIVEQLRRINGRLEIKQATHLVLHFGDIRVEHLLGEQLTLLRPAARIADGTCRSSR